MPARGQEGDYILAEVTPDPVMRIAMGFMAAKHLFVASEIGIFENLAGAPATLDELAAKSGIPHRTLRISTDAMVSLGLLECKEGRYRNSATAAAFLGGSWPGLAADAAFSGPDQLSGVDEARRRCATWRRRATI